MKCPTGGLTAYPLRKTYTLNRRYSVRFTFTGGALDCEWLPMMPPAELGRKLLPAYRQARNNFLRRLAPAVGSIMVVDV